MSYFMIKDIFVYWNDDNDAATQYLPDFKMKTLNLRGKEMATINYKEVLFTGIGELELSFSEVDPSFNTISLSFVSNILDIDPLKNYNRAYKV
jgi:hypothetical protein